MAQQLGINALSDTAVSALRIGKRLAEAARDGVQYTDIFALAGAYPDISVVASSARQALRELRDLTPDEAQDFTRTVADRADLPYDDTSFGKIRQGIALCADTYEFIADTYDGGRQLVYRFGDLFDIGALAAPSDGVA